jgi:hypothetical protein
VKAVGIQQPKGDDGYAQASCIEQYTFMVTRNIIDDVCLRDERIKLVKKYLRVEFDMHESDEEGDEEFREKLKVEISKIPFKSVPDQNEPRRDMETQSILLWSTFQVAELIKRLKNYERMVK